MIDTGSTLSLIQESCWMQLRRQEQCKPSQGQSFLLANGKKQTAIGKLGWECELHGRTLDLTLYIMRDADLTVPIILGMDFMLSSGIILDFRRSQYRLPSLKDADDDVTFPFLPQGSGSLVHFYLALSTPSATAETLQSIHQLVQETDTKQWNKELMLKWPTVCTNEIGQSSIVKHRIITTDEVPVRKRAYRVSREKQQFIEAEIKELLDKKIIRPSTSPWASPVVVVPKKDGGSRLCVDYRGLNAKTHLDAGLFEFLRLPFGLKNAAASFQRLMEHVLRELKGKCCLVYIDDVVVYSENEEKHLQHLNQVFSCLSNAGLTLNLKKLISFKHPLLS